MNWIIERRKQIGITQDELAARLQLRGFDVSRATISHWEVGRYTPPLHDQQFRYALADSLETNPKTLLKALGFEVEISHSEAAEQAAAIIDRMPEDTQKMILRIVEAIAKTG